MEEWLSFVACWLLIMVLIGGALWLVQLFRKKTPDGKEETVDPSSYKVVSPYDIDKKKKLEELEKN